MFADISKINYKKFGGRESLLRMIEGLGYRIERAAIGLYSVDQDFKACESSMSFNELEDHIGNLIENVLAFIEKRSPQFEDGDFEEILDKLEELYIAFENTTDEGLYQLATSSGHTIFNMINGPLEDALTHVGQINMMKRMAGVVSPAAGYMNGKEV